ncbi:MAG: MlaE family lipid ABC transporter permease subunit [Candidatus Latescibacterota bacterium]
MRPREGGLSLSGEVVLAQLALVEVQVRQCLQQGVADPLRIDLGGVTRLDTAGAVFLRRLPELGRQAGRQVVVGPLPEPLRSFYDFVRPEPAPAPPRPPRADLERLGEWVLRLNAELASLAFLASDLTWTAISAVFRRGGIRRDSLVEQATLIGLGGLPIVALITFLVGGVSALQGAAQLRKFGADIFVAELLAIGVTRELGPLMTAIVVAGRSGSAIAAEVATMKFTEELDALETMALDPLRFVAVPKMWALILCLPMLTILADLVGILGGALIGVTVMGISPGAFAGQVTGALFLKDILTGLLKSASFAWVIAVIGVHRGLRFSGGAVGVGRTTTASVVASIFAIIVLDAFWGLVFYAR